ncbi:MAG: glycosyltransferase, partial [Patescibacteria group bacterium]
KNFPHVVCNENKKNVGFPSANNQGAHGASGRYFLFLNPDMMVEKGSLDTLIDWMDAHPKIGIASVKLLDETGKINTSASPRRFPTVWNVVAIFFKLPHMFPRMLDQYLMRGIDPEKEQEVDSVRGAFMMMRRELYEQLGFAFDPRYFIWFEDVDVCREAKRLGSRVMYTPMISCIDRVGKSFEQKNFFWKQWQFFRSAMKYFWKWGL